MLDLHAIVADESPAEVVERETELGPAVAGLPRIAAGPEPEVGAWSTTGGRPVAPGETTLPPDNPLVR